jgi:hypothetical protein
MASLEVTDNDSRRYGSRGSPAIVLASGTLGEPVNIPKAQCLIAQEKRQG